MNLPFKIRKSRHTIEKSYLSNKVYLSLLVGSALLFSPSQTALGHKNDSPIKNDSSSVTKSDQHSTYKLTGIVVDEDGEPMIGVPVTIIGTKTGVLTNIDGQFTIDVANGQTLRIKFMGYSEAEILIKGQNNIRIILEEDTAMLDEAVVVGYGTQKKVSVVGSVQTVKADDLRVPSTALSSSFAGRLPGVIAVQRSGRPGEDGSEFYIRGISTFGGRKTPLIIVDGMQVSSGDLNNIDPEVIESFSILKDATATALYGTLGANGVMIVTTKSGKDMDKPKISIRLEAGVSTPTKVPKFVDGVQYMNMYNQAQKNPTSQSYIPYSQEKIENTLAGSDALIYPNVNWYEELFRDTQYMQRVAINIMGGSKKVDYFSSVVASHEDGMLKDRSKEFTSYSNNIQLYKFNFQNNINIYPTSTTKLSARLNIQLKDMRTPFNDVNTLFGYTVRANPVDFPVLFPSDDDRQLAGTTEHVMWGGKTSTNDRFINPLAELIRGYNTNFASTVIAGVEAQQDLNFILEGLKFKALYSFKNYSSTEIKRGSNYNQYFVNKLAIDPLTGAVDSYELERTTGDPVSTVLGLDGSSFGGDRRMYIQGMLDYSRIYLNVHSLNLMAVYNQDELNTNNPSSLMGSLPYRKQGLAGRVSYSYDDRYLIEGNFGYNGSENFAKGHRWGFFPSVAAGWVVGSEEFFKPIKPIVSHMKIRGSWGKVGNDQAGDRFVYLSELALSGAGYTTGLNQGYTQSGPVYKRFANSNITWEVGTKMNLGIDIEIARSLNIVFEIYSEHRNNIFLTRQTIPDFMGTSGTTIYGNLGKVFNKGFEFSADYYKAINKDLLLTFKGSFTFAKNKILEYDEPPYKLYPGQARVGHGVNQQLLYLADGLFIDYADIANSPEQKLSSFVNPGDIKYKEQPNIYGEYKGFIDPNDRLYYGRPTVPEIVYGFGPNVQYKKWDFAMFWQGAARTSLLMSGFSPFGVSYNRNVLKFIADDYWSEDNQNPNAKYPRLSIVNNENNSVASTYWLRDGSFLKLKTMEVGYRFPFVRVYVVGSNLLTLSKFKLWDPEMGGGAGLSYPTMTTVNVGAQFNF